MIIAMCIYSLKLIISKGEFRIWRVFCRKYRIMHFKRQSKNCVRITSLGRLFYKNLNSITSFEYVIFQYINVWDMIIILKINLSKN